MFLGDPVLGEAIQNISGFPGMVWDGPKCLSGLGLLAGLSLEWFGAVVGTGLLSGNRIEFP